MPITKKLKSLRAFLLVLLGCATIGACSLDNSANRMEENMNNEPVKKKILALRREKNIDDNSFENFLKTDKECSKIYYSKNIISIMSPLQNYKSFTEISLCENLITSIGGLLHMKGLLVLNLEKNLIEKINGLNNLESLCSLNISDNKIVEIEGLDNLKSLAYLDLSFNKIAKIQGLNSLEMLDSLVLSSNKIAKIEGLEKLIRLKSLNLGGNDITKIENLKNLKNLEGLVLGRNSISVIEGLKKLKKIKSVSLVINPIVSINVNQLPNHDVEFRISSTRYEVLSEYTIKEGTNNFLIKGMRKKSRKTADSQIGNENEAIKKEEIEDEEYEDGEDHVMELEDIETFLKQYEGYNDTLENFREKKDRSKSRGREERPHSKNKSSNSSTNNLGRKVEMTIEEHEEWKKKNENTLDELGSLTGNKLTNKLIKIGAEIEPTKKGVKVAFPDRRGFFGTHRLHGSSISKNREFINRSIMKLIGEKQENKSKSPVKNTKRKSSGKE